VPDNSAGGNGMGSLSFASVLAGAVLSLGTPDSAQCDTAYASG
jgi:hypothetical protein